MLIAILRGIGFLFHIPGSSNDDSNDGSWDVDVGYSPQGEGYDEHNDDGSSEEQHVHRGGSQEDRGYGENEDVSQQELYSESDGGSEGQMNQTKKQMYRLTSKIPLRGKRPLFALFFYDTLSCLLRERPVLVSIVCIVFGSCLKVHTGDHE